MAEKFSKFDPAEWLTTTDAFAVFMNEALATEDVDYLVHAIDVLIRAKGITQVAKQTGLSHGRLSRAFREASDPSIEMTFAVMKALGIQMVPSTVSAG